MLISFPGALGMYQGEELGQIETDIEFHELRDLGYIDFWPDNKGRDGCRTPMVWDASEAQAGFSTGEPWLPVKAPQIARSVAAQEARADSVLAAYRTALAFRKERDELRYGGTVFPSLPDPLLAVSRSLNGTVLTGVFNLSDSEHVVSLSAGATLVGESHATLTATSLTLPAFGFAFVETAHNTPAFA
jgi:alpha-glucosidase